MICLIEFNNIYAVIGWTILSIVLLIALGIVLKILSRKKINAKIGDKEISISDYRDNQEQKTEPIKQSKINKFEMKYKIDETIEKKEILDNIPKECLKEQMGVVSRCNTTMNLQMKEHYTQITGYTEGSFQWRYYCLCLLELVRQGGLDFCQKFLIENHIAEKTDDAYKIYCGQKKDEGWNIAKDIISSYYDDGLLTLNRVEYFQKAGQGLRMLYDKQMDNIFDEVRQIAIKYQKQSEQLRSELNENIDSLVNQCEE